jgi:hypothetical protein
MEIMDLVNAWFEKWENGEFMNLPISENFMHTSPYGTIEGKKAYIDLIVANIDKFLGHRFEIHDMIFKSEKACVRYTAIKDNFTLDVSEWHYVNNGEIEKIVAYYNIEGEISEDKKLSMPD